jgi:hypothetical protein
MAYDEQTWIDFNPKFTLSALRMSHLERGIAGEETRAKNAESSLSSEVASERSRAKSTEAELSIETSTERSRAEAAEKALKTEVGSERTRAEAGEKSAKEQAESHSIPLVQKGAVSGVATLDGTGKVPSSQLPPGEIVSTKTVKNEAALLALKPTKTEIVVVEEPEEKAYIWNGGKTGTITDWTTLTFATGIQEVNGKSGAKVNLTASDVSADSAGAAASAQTAAIAAATTKVNTEQSRAEAAEGTITSSVTTEKNRAKAAETAISVEVAGERTRAEGTEATIAQSVSNEANRAKGIEAALEATLTAEISRAKGAETSLEATDSALNTALASKVSNTDSRLSDERVPLNNTVSTAKVVNEAITKEKLSLSVQGELGGGGGGGGTAANYVNVNEFTNIKGEPRRLKLSEAKTADAAKFIQEAIEVAAKGTKGGPANRGVVSFSEPGEYTLKSFRSPPGGEAYHQFKVPYAKGGSKIKCCFHIQPGVTFKGPSDKSLILNVSKEALVEASEKTGTTEIAGEAEYAVVGIESARSQYHLLMSDVQITGELKIEGSFSSKINPKFLDGVICASGGIIERCVIKGPFRYAFCPAANHMRLHECQFGGWAKIGYTEWGRASGNIEYWSCDLHSGGVGVYVEKEASIAGDRFIGGYMGGGELPMFYKPVSGNGPAFLNGLTLSHVQFEGGARGLFINDDCKSSIRNIKLSHLQLPAGSDGPMQSAVKSDLTVPFDAFIKGSHVSGIEATNCTVLVNAGWEGSTISGGIIAESVVNSNLNDLTAVMRKAHGGGFPLFQLPPLAEEPMIVEGVTGFYTNPETGATVTLEMRVVKEAVQQGEVLRRANFVNPAKEGNYGATPYNQSGGSVVGIAMQSVGAGQVCPIAVHSPQAAQIPVKVANLGNAQMSNVRISWPPVPRGGKTTLSQALEFGAAEGAAHEPPIVLIGTTPDVGALWVNSLQDLPSTGGFLVANGVVFSYEETIAKGTVTTVASVPIGGGNKVEMTLPGSTKGVAPGMRVKATGVTEGTEVVWVDPIGKRVEVSRNMLENVTTTVTFTAVANTINGVLMGNTTRSAESIDAFTLKGTQELNVTSVEGFPTVGVLQFAGGPKVSYTGINPVKKSFTGCTSGATKSNVMRSGTFLILSGTPLIKGKTKVNRVAQVTSLTAGSAKLGIIKTETTGSVTFHASTTSGGIVSTVKGVGPTTLTVANATGFATSGTLRLGIQELSYSGLSGNTFSGVKGWKGTAEYTNGSPVVEVLAIPVVAAGNFSNKGKLVISGETYLYSGLSKAKTSFEKCYPAALTTKTIANKAVVEQKEYAITENIKSVPITGGLSLPESGRARYVAETTVTEEGELISSNEITVKVVSTAGFPAEGTIRLLAKNLNYTSISPTEFKGIRVFVAKKKQHPFFVGSTVQLVGGQEVYYGSRTETELKEVVGVASAAACVSGGTIVAQVLTPEGGVVKIGTHLLGYGTAASIKGRNFLYPVTTPGGGETITSGTEVEDRYVVAVDGSLPVACTSAIIGAKTPNALLTEGFISLSGEGNSEQESGGPPVEEEEEEQGGSPPEEEGQGEELEEGGGYLLLPPLIKTTTKGASFKVSTKPETVEVESTTGLPSFGKLTIGSQALTYSGITVSSFTGVKGWDTSSTEEIVTGTPVLYAYWDNELLSGIIMGGTTLTETITVTGGAGPTFLPVVNATGFPSHGKLKVGNQVLKYEGVNIAEKKIGPITGYSGTATITSKVPIVLLAGNVIPPEAIVKTAIGPSQTEAVDRGLVRAEGTGTEVGWSPGGDRGPDVVIEF